MNSFTQKTKDILRQFHFNEIPFNQLRQNFKSQKINSSYQITQTIEPLSKNMIKKLPDSDLDLEKYAEYKKVGLKAIQNGQVGVAILNGGMATRFGGTPKGIVPVVGTRSFIDLKISQVFKVGGLKVPVFLMNSYATEQATNHHVKELNVGSNVKNFRQFVSLRLCENGDYFFDKNEEVSLYSPGHGDFPYAFKASLELKKFIANGGKYITLSNVDNLGASLDPVVIGSHIKNKKPVSVELVKSQDGDIGGFPATVNNKTFIIEAFRLPKSFDTKTIDIFNTNTFVFDVESIQNPPALDWFFVKKEVEKTQVIQFERLVGQMTEHFKVNWILVSRSGEKSRFIPVKNLSDVNNRQNELKAVLSYQGIL